MYSLISIAFVLLELLQPDYWMKPQQEAILSLKNADMAGPH